MADWQEITKRTLTELEGVDDTYRPTNFWGPGLTQLLNDMEQQGLERFKSWSTASIWFNPIYGNGWTNARMAALLEHAQEINPSVNKDMMFGALNGSLDARRDYDVACSAWDQVRWPFDLSSSGESSIGRPSQAYRVTGRDELKVGRAWNNYLLILSALSQHVDEVPRSFLEIGGGFGVLGEIVMSRDPEARYVDLDIPPLLTVSSYYLTELFGEDRVSVYDQQVAQAGEITLPGSGVLPNYRVSDLGGQYDVFVNSYSFQEMEPAVVDHYIGQVCDKGITYACSLNSKDGKPKAAKAGDWGALDPVKSSDIVEMFEKRGLQLVGQYDAPMVRSAGQLNIFKRD